MSLLVCCILFYFVSLCVCLYFESLLIAICYECAPRERKKKERKNQKQEKEEEEEANKQRRKIEPHRVFFFNRQNHCLRTAHWQQQQKKNERQRATIMHTHTSKWHWRRRWRKRKRAGKPLRERETQSGVEQGTKDPRRILSSWKKRGNERRRKKEEKRKKEDKQIGCSIDRWKSSSLATDSLPLHVLGLDGQLISCLYFF